MDAYVPPLEEGDDLLEDVDLGRGNADFVSLDGHLGLELLSLDQLDDLPGLFDGDAGPAVLEVETVPDLLQGDVDGVGHFLEVDAGDDVERMVLSHGGVILALPPRFYKREEAGEIPRRCPGQVLQRETPDPGQDAGRLDDE